MVGTIYDFKIFSNIIDKEWALKELNDFLNYIKVLKVFDAYDKNDEVFKYWYSYIHLKLKEYDFKNGESEENTLEKRPKAVFWFFIYCTFISGFTITQKTLKQEMINLICKAKTFFN